MLPIRDEMRMIQAMLALAWDGTKMNVAWCLLFIITAHLPSCCAHVPHAVIQDVVTSTTTVSVPLLIPRTAFLLYLLLLPFFQRSSAR